MNRRNKILKVAVIGNAAVQLSLALLMGIWYTTQTTGYDGMSELVAGIVVWVFFVSWLTAIILSVLLILFPFIKREDEQLPYYYLVAAIGESFLVIFGIASAIINCVKS